MTSRQSLKRANPPPNRTTEERGNGQGQSAMPARLPCMGGGGLVDRSRAAVAYKLSGVTQS